jgi:hypothetical protein
MADRKVCGSCSRTLSVSNFWRDRARPDGLQNACKDCRRAIQRTYVRSGGYVLFDADGKPWLQPPIPEL